MQSGVKIDMANIRRIGRPIPRAPIQETIGCFVEAVGAMWFSVAVYRIANMAILIQEAVAMASGWHFQNNLINLY
jgi:hypothetical protein